MISGCIYYKSNFSQGYGKVLSINNTIATINPLILISRPFSNNLILKYMNGMKLDASKIITLDLSTYDISTILVLHVSVFSPLQKICYYPGMEDIFYISEMTNNGKNTLLDDDNIPFFLPNYQLIGKSLRMGNNQSRAFEINRSKLHVIKAIHEQLRKKKIRSSSMKVCPGLVSPIFVEELFNVIDTANTQVCKSQTQKSREVVGIYSKINNCVTKSIIGVDFVSRILTSVDPLKHFFGSDWNWQALTRSRESNTNFNLANHDIRKIRSDDLLSRLEFIFNLTESTLVMNFKIMNISIGNDGREVLMDELRNADEDFLSMPGKVVKQENNIWVCVYAEVIVNIGKTKNGMNTNNFVIHVLPGEVYNDDNFELTIQKCMHDLQFIKINYDPLGIKSFGFEEIKNLSKAHPFCGLIFKNKKIFFDENVDVSRCTMWIVTEIYKENTIDSICFAVRNYIEIWRYHLSDIDIRRCFLEFQLDFVQEECNLLETEGLTNYFLEIFRFTLIKECPNLEVQSKRSRKTNTLF